MWRHAPRATANRLGKHSVLYRHLVGRLEQHRRLAVAAAAAWKLARQVKHLSHRPPNIPFPAL